MSNKFIINVGFARSGTTTLHHYFDNSSAIVPKKEKEIKAFFREIDKNRYLDFFEAREVFVKENIFFESSPQYAHVSERDYKDVINRISKALGRDNVKIIFNVREPISRAFSNYWHNIGSHHSVYGSLWTVRNGNDPKRFNQVYNKSFYDTLLIRRIRDNLFPNYSEIIKHAIDVFGLDSVFIIPLWNFDEALSILTDKIKVSLNTDNSFHANKSFRPRYYLSRDSLPALHTITTIKGDYLVRVPRNSMLLLSNKFCEVLSGEKFEINKIANAALHWSEYVNTEQVRSIMGSYFEIQKKEILDIPDECFIGSSASEFSNKFDQTGIIKAKNSDVVTHDLDKVKGLEVLSKC